ncbi:MAG TPA: hypothetical protein VML75_24730 [Kofleriaceae bacterium]|nr:hypothetical protein [Kofleriaceae bacterium]
MKKTMLLVFAGIAALTCGSIGAAHADDGEITKDNYPVVVVDRPILVPQGMLELRGNTAIINMSKGSAGDPISLAPDIYYGVNKKLNIGITHVDGGICAVGDACDKAYNAVGVDALYDLMHGGSLLAALRAGVRIPSFDPLIAGLNLGVDVKLAAGKVAVYFNPSLYVGAIKRSSDATPPEPFKKEELDVPLILGYQAQRQTLVFLRTGMHGPLSGFGDAVQVPIGVGATFAANNRLDFGAEWLFLNLAGKGGSADGRAIIVRIALRL